ncbi:MAG: hypothetical protein V2A79_18590 [Planctomycetota bacterium]
MSRMALTPLAMLCGLALSAAHTADQKPNIVLVLMDNFGWGELGCYGGGILRGAPTREYGVPLLYNLHLDPKEEHALNYGIENTWVRWPAGQVLVEHLVSLKKEPPIRPSAPDPYAPPGIEKIK